MAYRLQDHESIPQGITRITRDQIDRATSALTDETVDLHDGVHEARKCFKEIRGVLRLVRFALGGVYQEENTCYRDLGRTLSAVRDATALIETVDRLQDTFEDDVVPETFGALREALVAHRESLTEDADAMAARIRGVLKALHKARERVASWPLSSDRFSALGPGLKKTYRRGRKAFHRAYEDPTPEHFHEWRKRVKYHWYHSQLLHNTWPSLMNGYRSSLDDLSDRLGVHHDLSVFRQTLLDRADDFGSARDLQVVLGLIDRHQLELAVTSETLGQRIFAEKPTHLHTRFEAYWDAWRAETHHAARLAR